MQPGRERPPSAAPMTPARDHAARASAEDNGVQLKTRGVARKGLTLVAVATCLAGCGSVSPQKPPTGHRLCQTRDKNTPRPEQHGQGEANVRAETRRRPANRSRVLHGAGNGAEPSLRRADPEILHRHNRGVNVSLAHQAAAQRFN